MCARPGESIEFYNRYTDQVEREQIYGEAPLRWVYESGLGRVALWAFVRRPFLSALYGYLMSRGSSRKRVAPFVRDYGLDPGEFADGLDSYRSFNDFFYRKLKPEVRPICGGESEVAFPADGRHLAVQDLGNEQSFFVKGQKFDVEALLGSSELAERYRGGSLVLSRLCPVDYHRFHFAVGGHASPVRQVNGLLYSVNPIALRSNLAYLWENKRTIVEIENEVLGRVIQMEIGATNVGSINATFMPGSVRKGEEKGYFAFGGSATITVFEPGVVELSEDLLRESANCREVYAHMGDVMARASG